MVVMWIINEKTYKMHRILNSKDLFTSQNVSTNIEGKIKKIQIQNQNPSIIKLGPAEQ